MSTKHLTCVETAKLIRQTLKEAFPDVKFSVKSKTYSGGASIRVGWTDGPNSNQVEAVAGKFQASYFDSSIDYKGSIYHMLNGEQVRFGADFIFFERDYGTAAVQSAIDSVFRRYAGNFSQDGRSKPTAEQYGRGDLWCIRLSGLHNYGNENLQREIGKVLAKNTDRLRIRPSTTAGKIFITHDDGYSRACGSGMTAVADTTL